MQQRPGMTPSRRFLLRAAACLPLWPGAPAVAQDTENMPLPALLAQAETLDPASLYILAGRLFADGQREDATRWFYVAQLRARYHLAVVPGLSPDAEPALYGALQETIGRPVNEWAFGDIDAAAASMQAALDWDAAHPNGFIPKDRDPAALDQVRAGLVRLRATLLTQREDIKRQRTENGLENR